VTEQAISKVTMDKLVSLCKRRGYIFPSSEIYGGLGACYDYGPLGVELKNNVKACWWKSVVQERDDMVGLDASILMHPQTWVASGHVDGFADPLVDCKQCRRRWRADDVGKPLGAVQVYDQVDASEARADLLPAAGQIVIRNIKIDGSNGAPQLESAGLVAGGIWLDRPLPKSEVQLIGDDFLLSPGNILYPNLRSYTIGFPLPSGAALGAQLKLVFRNPSGLLERVDFTVQFSGGVTKYEGGPYCPDCCGDLTEPRMFNLMFKTYVGAVEDEAEVVYLRPETAQGIFVNFENVLASTRRKLPFGIAQIGKAFRNEITTGNFIFRTREFEQMEIEYFVKPGSDDEWFQRWVDERLNWYVNLGIRRENLRLHQHAKDKLAHYAKDCTDIEYLLPMGWSELEGIANRTDFDLRQHARHSGKDLSYYDEDTKEHITPYVIEPSAGVDRSVLAFLVDAYDEEPDKDEVRVVLRLHPALAPIKVAVLPLSKNEKLLPLSQEVYNDLRRCWMVQYDNAQSIGRRYRRQDEIGTPFCVTIDFDSLEDNAVTIRERDSMKQIRVPIEALKPTLDAKMCGEPF